MGNMVENNVVENFNDETIVNETNEEFFVVIKDEVIQGLCSSKERALELMNEMAEKDMELAPITDIYRREYDELKMTLKIYAQSWTMAIFPHERIEHYYFVTPVERID
jgi:hypothetical protein